MTRRADKRVVASLHAACVDAWMARVGSTVPAADLGHHVGVALGRILGRARVLLGDITLTAVANRVFWTARKQFPVLCTVITPSCEQTTEDAEGTTPESNRDELLPAVRYLLLELLTVLGNLTAQILTPALHAELSTLSRAGSAQGRNEAGHRGESPRGA